MAIRIAANLTQVLSLDTCKHKPPLMSSLRARNKGGATSKLGKRLPRRVSRAAGCVVPALLTSTTNHLYFLESAVFLYFSVKAISLLTS